MKSKKQWLNVSPFPFPSPNDSSFLSATEAIGEVYDLDEIEKELEELSRPKEIKQGTQRLPIVSSPIRVPSEGRPSIGAIDDELIAMLKQMSIPSNEPEGNLIEQPQPLLDQ